MARKRRRREKGRQTPLPPPRLFIEELEDRIVPTTLTVGVMDVFAWEDLPDEEEDEGNLIRAILTGNPGDTVELVDTNGGNVENGDNLGQVQILSSSAATNLVITVYSLDDETGLITLEETGGEAHVIGFDTELEEIRLEGTGGVLIDASNLGGQAVTGNTDFGNLVIGGTVIGNSVDGAIDINANVNLLYVGWLGSQWSNSATV